MKPEAVSEAGALVTRRTSSSEKSRPAGEGDTPLFSLVVCTRGRTEELDRFLQSVANQVGGIRCEVIVVDQNADARLDSILEAYNDRLEIERMRSPVGLSRGRNLALARLRGSVIAFPDDDCVYPETLLSAVSARLSSLPIAEGVSVMSRGFDGKASGPRWGAKEGWIRKDRVFRQAISYGLFLRAGLIRRVGAFDESLGLGAGTPWQSGEETDYVVRALAQGFRILYVPSLCALHPDGRRSTSFFPKQVRYAAGSGRLVKLHKFTWSFRARFLAAPFLRAMVALLCLSPGNSRWQLRIGFARWRGYSTRREVWAQPQAASPPRPPKDKHGPSVVSSVK